MLKCALTLGLVLGLTLILAGCATGYNSGGAWGGYYDQQVSSTQWEIEVDGNSFTNANRVEDIAMLRAAEITLENGGTNFVLQRSNTNSDPHVIRSGGYFAGNTYIPARKDHYESYNAIMLVEIVRAGTRGSYVAADVVQSLGPRFSYTGPQSPVGSSPIDRTVSNPVQK